MEVAYLSTDITELSSNAKHKFVLFAHWLVDVSGQASALLSLQCHVCVCDLGDGTEEEDDGEEEHECCDSEVCPLDLAQVVGIGVTKENSRCQQGSHD